jgi:hypothetical protein
MKPTMFAVLRSRSAPSCVEWRKHSMFIVRNPSRFITSPPGSSDKEALLVLLRHGQSIWNLEKRFTGWCDVSLTDEGIEEAEEAGMVLASVRFNYLWSFFFSHFLIRTCNSRPETVIRRTSLTLCFLSFCLFIFLLYFAL